MTGVLQPEAVGTYEPALPRAIAPPREPARVASLDVLRGVALLGILLMNVQAFAMVGSAYDNPTSYGDLTGANYWTWLVEHLLIDEKMYGTFAMLFGAGILLMRRNVERSGGPAAKLHYRRMGWLIVFGLLHAHLLWSGDILYTYGVCGLIAYRFCNAPPRRLAAVGLLFIAVGSTIMIATGRWMRSWPPSRVASFEQDMWRPTPAQIADEERVQRGSWRDQLPGRSEDALAMETLFFVAQTGWKTLGLMLVGMAFLKTGILGAGRSRKVYLLTIAAGLLVGIPVELYGVARDAAAHWDVRWSFFFGSQFKYWGSVFVACAWIGAVMLASTSSLARFTAPLAALGRTALTNYILQTLICTTLFSGWGFALFGRLDRVAQLGVVAAVWVVQLTLAPLWLRRFRLGPLEWVWRSLTYGKVQPMRGPA